MAREELSDLGEERRMEGLIRGMAILGLPPQRYGTLDAKRGKDKLWQVGALLLALALGHRDRQGRCRGTLGRPPDPARRRLKVPRAALPAKPHAGADRTGGQKPPRPAVVEAIEDAAHRLGGKGLRGDGRAQKQVGVVVGAALCSTVQGTTAPQRLQAQAQHDGACGHVHRCRASMLHEADETQVVGRRCENGQRLHGIPGDLGR